MRRYVKEYTFSYFTVVLRLVSGIPRDYPAWEKRLYTVFFTILNYQKAIHFKFTRNNFCKKNIRCQTPL